MHDVQQQAYPVERAPPARQYLLGQTTGPDGESDTTEGENDMSRMHVTVLQYLLEILDRAGPIAEGNARFAAPDKRSHTSPSARSMTRHDIVCYLNNALVILLSILSAEVQSCSAASNDCSRRCA